MCFRGFLKKLRTFEKLVVWKRGDIGHDIQERYVIGQLTTLVSHYDVFALWHTVQRSPLFQSAVSRGLRLECIAVNIRFLLTMFNGGAGDVCFGSEATSNNPDLHLTSKFRGLSKPTGNE
jgi:hypothetical protein